jgi:archaellum component FlaC
MSKANQKSRKKKARERGEVEEETGHKSNCMCLRCFREKVKKNINNVDENQQNLENKFDLMKAENESLTESLGKTRADLKRAEKKIDNLQRELEEIDKKLESFILGTGKAFSEVRGKIRKVEEAKPRWFK